MAEYQMGLVESKFADIIWENEPLTSSALVKLCAERLEWKKSTTYTVLKRLCEKGIFKNEGGCVTSLLKRDEFYSAQSEKYIEESFGGSLPDFLAAFTSGKELTEEEVSSLRAIVEEYENKRR